MEVDVVECSIDNVYLTSTVQKSHDTTILGSSVELTTAFRRNTRDIISKFYNIFYADGELLGGYSNQYILLIGAFVAMIGGFLNKVSLSIIGHIYQLNKLRQ